MFARAKFLFTLLQTDMGCLLLHTCDVSAKAHHEFRSAGVSAAQLRHSVQQQMKVHRALTGVGQATLNHEWIADLHSALCLEHCQPKVPIFVGLLNEIEKKIKTKTFVFD